jgi:RNA polymerase sigma factor (sigma-70 family)
MTKSPEKDKGLPGRPSLNILPGMRAAMAAQGYTRVSTLWRAFSSVVEAEQEGTLSYQRVLDLSNGEGCFDPASGGYTPMAELMADFLKASPADVFGAMPNDPRAYDVDLDQLEQAQRIEGYSQPEDHVWQRQREKALDECFAKLALTDKRGAQVIRMRHGLDGDEPMSFEAIASAMDISSERVRQMEARALFRLRALIIKSYATPSAPNGWAPRYTLNI